MIKWFKSRGFTDRLYIVNFIMTWLFVWGCFIASLILARYEVTDVPMFSVAIGCAFTELGFHTSYVVWKSKSENIAKFGNKDNIQM